RRELKLSVQEGSRYIGVLAAYRNLPDTNWRFVIPLDEKGRNQMRLHLDADGIRDLDIDGRERN
ncbi:MAG: type VI secretion system lipoprotein TssJ, partial [Pseudomonas sp.]